MKWLMNFVKFCSGQLIDRHDLDLLDIQITALRRHNAELRDRIDTLIERLDYLESQHDEFTQRIRVDGNGDVTINGNLTVTPRTDALADAQAYLDSVRANQASDSPQPSLELPMTGNTTPQYVNFRAVQEEGQVVADPRAVAAINLDGPDRGIADVNRILGEISTTMESSLRPYIGQSIQSSQVNNVRLDPETNTMHGDVVIQMPRSMEYITVNLDAVPSVEGRPDDTTNERQLDPHI